MSLLGSLNLGGSALAAQQLGLQVTGNNIANAGTPGYNRQVATLSEAGSTPAGGVSVGNGVNVTSVTRQVNAALNESVRDATSDQSAAQQLNSLLTQLQTTFGTLNDNDLSAQMTSFFNSFSTLANDPSNKSQQALVIQNGVSMAQSLQQLQGQLANIGATANTQVSTLAQQADSLAGQIATLNGQIAQSQGGAGPDNALLDQRDQDLAQLSQYMDIKVVDQGNGNLNVLVHGMPLVQGATSRGVATKASSDANGDPVTNVVFGDNGDAMNVTGGQLGALTAARDSYISPAIGAVDTLAAGMISVVNGIYSQGQAATGYASVTGATAVTDPTAALNAPLTQTGIAFPPANGAFDLYLTDSSTGQTTTQQIAVNLSGQGTQTSLNSLAASISAAGGGTVNATVDASGHLSISSNNPNVTFGFGNDSSGALAALGVNTFFTGTDATNIGVNTVLTTNPAMLATGRDNAPGSNTNAQALALAGGAGTSVLGGKSLQDYYADYVGNLATAGLSAANNVTAQGAIHDALYAQQQSLSGVSMDEEAVNLTKYQRAFEGSARFITVVDEMMQTVLGLIQ